MKTQEEIEQLANDKYLQRAEAISDSTIKGYIVSAVKGGFVDGYTQCQEDNNKEQDWTNFEGELMDASHQLGQEQKYIPFPVQVLEWLKNNYKLPQKK